MTNKFGKYFYCVEISTLWRLMNLNVSPEIGDQENNEKDAALCFHLIDYTRTQLQDESEQKL